MKRPVYETEENRKRVIIIFNIYRQCLGILNLVCRLIMNIPKEMLF
jgi:hypothetical protein